MSCEIEVQVGSGTGPGEFDARVVHAVSGGEPAAVMHLDVESLLRNRDRLESTVLASAVSARRVLPAGEQQLRGVGKLLFDSLFSGPVYGAYRASMGVALQRGERLRVVLRLTAPELAALPWEALFDSETETYVCRKEPLVRHVPAPYTPDPLEVVPPLRVLGLVASPRGLPALDVAAEQEHLAEALAEPISEGLIDLQWLPQATWNGVHAKLLSGEWHVLHFVGHGDYSVENDQGLIALVGTDGRADLIEAERLADLLGEAQPTPRLVVLNSCSSGESGTQDLFSGTAAALVRSGISAVAAMQFTVSDVAAIAFARGFYTAIAHGRGVDEATRSGRIAILGAPHTLEWVTPVLYLRGDSTQLFNLDLPHQLTARERTAEEEAQRSSREAQLHAMYLRARAELRAKRYPSAMEVLDDLSSLDPDYRDTAELRDTATRRLRLADKYQRATQAQAFGDWSTAAQLFGDIVTEDPDYEDAASRLQTCEASQRIADLQEEMRYHADAGNWRAVTEVSDEIASADPSAADPGGLAGLARESLEAEARTNELARRYRQARAAEDAQQWVTAAQAYAAVLELDPDYRDAGARKENCLRHQRLAELVTSPPKPPVTEGRGTAPQPGPKQATENRFAMMLDTRWLAAVLGLVLVVLLIALSEDSMPDAVRASRPGQPMGLGEDWWAVVWMLPFVPAAVAAFLLLRRREIGVALGCTATAALWVATSWILISSENDSGTTGIHVLLLAALLGTFIALVVAERAWQGLRLNQWDRALSASLFVLAAILLHTQGQFLTFRALWPKHAEAFDYGNALTLIPAIIVPLLIGVPAAALRHNRLLTPALTTMAWFVLAYDVLLRSAGMIKYVKVVDNGYKELAQGLGIVLFILGSLCVVLAVRAGQRWGRTTSPSEHPPIGAPS